MHSALGYWGLGFATGYLLFLVWGFGYPAKKTHAGSDCTLHRSFVALHQDCLWHMLPSLLSHFDQVDRIVRAAHLALSAEHTCLACADARLAIYDLQGLFGAEGDADPAAFAPGGLYYKLFVSDQNRSP